jgi:hypothetical protein
VIWEWLSTVVVNTHSGRHIVLTEAHRLNRLLIWPEVDENPEK